ERRARDRGRQQKVVRLEEPAWMLPPGKAIEPGLDVLGRRLAQESFDERQQPGIDLAATIEIRREPQRESTAEHLLPVRLGGWPAWLHVVHAASHFSERLHRVRTDGPDLGVDRVIETKVVRVRHAQAFDRAAELLRPLDALSQDRARIALV